MSINTISKMLIAFSVVMIFMAMSMDTSVSTGYGRVNNLGLLNDQNNMLILGGIGFLAGIILFATGKIKQTPEDVLVEKAEAEQRLQVVEQKLEKASQAVGSVSNKTFNFLDAWIGDKRDNIPGRIAVFVFLSPFAIFSWPPLIILLGVYAYRPIPASKVMTHLLYLQLAIDLLFLVVSLTLVGEPLPVQPSQSSVDRGIYILLTLSIISFLAILFIKKRELNKPQTLA